MTCTLGNCAFCTASDYRVLEIIDFFEMALIKPAFALDAVLQYSVFLNKKQETNFIGRCSCKFCQGAGFFSSASMRLISSELLYAWRKLETAAFTSARKCVRVCVCAEWRESSFARIRGVWKCFLISFSYLILCHSEVTVSLKWPGITAVTECWSYCILC